MQTTVGRGWMTPGVVMGGGGGREKQMLRLLATSWGSTTFEFFGKFEFVEIFGCMGEDGVSKNLGKYVVFLMCNYKSVGLMGYTEKKMFELYRFIMGT